MKNMISCKVAAQLMSKSLDRRLSLIEWIKLKSHTVICKACVFYYSQIKGIKDICEKYPEACYDPPAGDDKSMPEDARQRIKSSLRKKNS